MLKLTLILLGTISLGIGVTGIFIPGLPTTPFLLITAALYARSSDKLYHRLLEAKFVGSYIKEFRRNKGLYLQTKIFSIAVMWIMILVSVLFLIPSSTGKLIVLGVGAIGTIVMGFLIPTSAKQNK